MIIFHGEQPILEDVYRLMGDMFIPHKMVFLFTLYGMHMQGEMLSGLLPDMSTIPAECILNETESDFDYYYWKQLLENEWSKQYVYKLMFYEYQYGPNCLILIQTDLNSPFASSVTESLSTFINVMYGLDPKTVYAFDDLCDALVDPYSGFSTDGIRRITQDMVYYTKMNQTELSFTPEV